MTGELTIDRKFHITRQHLGRKKLREGSPTKQPTGRIPRVARVMALAIRCEQLIRDGVIKNQSELAHYGQITTARMTHIMWLAPWYPFGRQLTKLPKRSKEGEYDDSATMQHRRFVPERY